MQMPQDQAADSVSRMIIQAWLASVVDAFNVIFSRLAGRPEYRLRASVVVFGKTSGIVSGKHWLFYAGDSPLHREKPFDDSSIAYRVVSSDLPTPTYQKLNAANKEAQNRGTDRYSSFYAFRVTSEVALAIDWPEEVLPDDPFVSAARDFVHTELSPGIQRLLSRWSRSVAVEIGLDPLRSSPPAGGASYGAEPHLKVLDSSSPVI
jgi:hypothetical protein